MNAAVAPVPVHPWPDPVASFVAVAMPNGDGRFGVAGPMVQLIETATGGGHGGRGDVRRREPVPKLRLLSRAEAGALHVALGAALATFEAGAAFDAFVEAAGGFPSDGAEADDFTTGPARAARGPYPFRCHRTLADAFQEIE